MKRSSLEALLPKFVFIVLFAMFSAALLTGQSPAGGQSPEIATTYPTPGGNRYVDVSLNLHAAGKTVVELPAQPLWVTGAANEAGVALVAILEDGRIFRARITRGEPLQTGIMERRSPAPPVVLVDRTENGSIPRLTVAAGELYAGNSLSAPYPLSAGTEDETLAIFITPEGDLNFRRGSRVTTLSTRALADSRIVQAEANRLLVLGRPSTEYRHGILGDETEAAGLILVELTGSSPLVFQRPLRASGVIETLIPLVANVIPDTPVEVVLPLSTGTGGTRIVVTDVTGMVLAEGPPIGRGSRWRHPLAAGPFGPSSETEIVATRTPHIGGSLEYYRVRGDELELVHNRTGYSTHRMGSRNLDAAVAADFTGNGRADLLVPNQDFRSLAVVERTESGSEEKHSIQLSGELVTNLALMPFGDRAALAAGLSDNTLIVWQSPR